MTMNKKVLVNEGINDLIDERVDEVIHRLI